MAKTPQDTPRVFQLVARTQAEEDAYDIKANRKQPKPSGLIGSIAHLVKGALGGGILSGHVAWMTAGLWVAMPVSLCCGIYMFYCLNILVMSAQILYKRTRVPSMTYSDVGEAACACHSNESIRKLAKTFRYMIDAMICIDLFGSCATYQIIIAKSLKQLVENTQTTSMEGAHGMPGLRFYLACLIPFVIMICLIRHLKWLAPLSIVANIFPVFCIMVAVYYAFENNPTFTGMVPYTSLYNFFEFIGMAVFSMSCAAVIIPIENNMKEPAKYRIALGTGMTLIITCVFCVSFFGYSGYLDKCESPITVNFPLNALGKTLKASIMVMIYVTHALNYWVPFTTVFYYMKRKLNPAKHLMWELFFRGLFVAIIGLVAIIFPTITALMGFLGAFCLSNLAFIYPNVIYLLVHWERPGLGTYRWRLWISLVMITVGIFFCICGSYISAVQLILIALNPSKRSDI
ncbi:PREDICTED: proton-coupled amino acid transporter 4-like [Papilio polytes]|uniref:proton-coupled amino acid transporter 4-like n=1 Tax=Papilio polytes TaxID=76194 RepID=UPI00067609A2|nr:PREDICTED: proton-coupled amino acid transporter 4-like [Papilio polytes]